MSSSSYLLGSFLGFFCKIATILRPLHRVQPMMLEQLQKNTVPIVADGLSRAIVLVPASSGRLLAAEPLLEFVGSHVDEFIELSASNRSVI